MANRDTQSKKDNLAFIIGGLFILGLVFATYNYFNKTPGTGGEEEEKSTIEKIKDIISADSDEDQGVQAVESVSTPAETEQSTQAWVATNYVEGDIQKGNYTVKSGDTLWEIAEAVYGNGSEWIKILEANASSVGYLPNGEQALIMPGQVLVLP